MNRFTVFLVAVAFVATAQAAPDDKPKTARDGLKPLNELIGDWPDATGTPEGSPKEKQDIWKETVSFSWKFKGDDAWITVTFDKGRHFKSGEIRYLPDKDRYQLKVMTKDDKELVFEGQLTEKGRVLAVERTDEQKKETQRIVFRLVGEIRFTYTYESKPVQRKLFTKNYMVAGTRKGESFGLKEKKPECVVTGGLGTMTVSYKGQTFYVCCTGCRDAFNDNPEKYIKEFQERKAKEAKGG